jgi:class 3 adenylate cyclase
MSFDWSKLSDEEAFDAIETVPMVYGPYVATEGGFVRRMAGHTIVVGVSRGSSGGWNGSYLFDTFQTAEAAMRAVDAELRSRGARLVGPSKVPT